MLHGISKNDKVWAEFKDLAIKIVASPVHWSTFWLVIHSC